MTIPVGTSIPARGHLLLAKNSTGGYSLSAYAAADLTYATDIPDNSSLALFNTSIAANFIAANRLDAVGFTGAAQPCLEGTPLSPINATTEEHSFLRIIPLATERPQDSDNNASDFVLISTTGSVGGSAVVLGAPGPENRTSPTAKSPAQIPGSYIDPTQCQGCAPNRVVEGTSPRLLKIRRTYTNNTGAPVTRLRFRVFDITTFNSPNPGGAQADLRPVSSTTESVSTMSGSVTVKGLTREEPPDQTSTGQDGGLNTTLSDNSITLPTPLPQGGKTTISYWMRIVSGGKFRFFVNVEALN